MALGLASLPMCSGFVSVGRGSMVSNINGPSPRPTCPLSFVRVLRSIDGSLARGFEFALESRVKAISARSLAEIDGAHSPSMRLIARGLIERRSNLSDLVVKVIANLQLLGILTAVAVGVAGAPPLASASGSISSTERRCCFNSVEKSSAKLSEPSDFERVDEGTTVTEFRQDAGQSQRAVGHSGGIDILRFGAPEDSIGGDEFEDFSAKPYTITVPLRIVGLRGSVPPTWLKDFLSSQGKRVKLKTEFQSSLRSIFSELSSALESQQLSARSVMAADLVTIGDSWLSKAVSSGLIKPIENAEQYQWYQRMGSKWQTFLRRDENGNIDSNGKVWGVPYRWGSLVIAYNRNKLQQHGIAAIKVMDDLTEQFRHFKITFRPASHSIWGKLLLLCLAVLPGLSTFPYHCWSLLNGSHCKCEIQDWTDLWNPELAGKISMVASPREIVGAILKVLGASYNVNNFDTEVSGGRQAMKEKFLAFQHQVRFFDDIQYLKALAAGEVWVAVGWSDDIISVAKRSSHITVVAPESGTSIWADLWAIPATTTIRSTTVGGRVRGPSPLVLQWFDFCLQPARANSFAHSVLAGASPLILSDQIECTKSKELTPGNTKPLGKEICSDDRQVETGPTLEIDLLGLLTPDLIARCEFLEPLSETALVDFKWLLSRNAFVQRLPVPFPESLKIGCGGS